MDVTLTKEEQKAIRKLENLAKKWPESLSLFSWSGSLNVIKDQSVITVIIGIENDGGDPDDIDVYGNSGFHGSPNITYE